MIRKKKRVCKESKAKGKEPVISLLGEETKFSLLAVPAATKACCWSLSWFGQTEERCVLGGQKKNLGWRGEIFTVRNSGDRGSAVLGWGTRGTDLYLEYVKVLTCII